MPQTHKKIKKKIKKKIYRPKCRFARSRGGKKTKHTQKKKPKISRPFIIMEWIDSAEWWDGVCRDWVVGGGWCRKNAR